MNDFECPICYEALCGESGSPDDVVVATPCGHLFHKKCILTWLGQPEGEKTCPSCMQKLNEKQLLKLALKLSPIPEKVQERNCSPTIPSVGSPGDSPSPLVLFLRNNHPDEDSAMKSLNCAEFQTHHSSLL
jgi:hypothetical protein